MEWACSQPDHQTARAEGSPSGRSKKPGKKTCLAAPGTGNPSGRLRRLHPPQVLRNPGASWHELKS